MYWNFGLGNGGILPTPMLDRICSAMSRAKPLEPTTVGLYRMAGPLHSLIRLRACPQGHGNTLGQYSQVVDKSLPPCPFCCRPEGIAWFEHCRYLEVRRYVQDTLRLLLLPHGDQEQGKVDPCLQASELNWPGRTQQYLRQLPFLPDAHRLHLCSKSTEIANHIRRFEVHWESFEGNNILDSVYRRREGWPPSIRPAIT